MTDKYDAYYADIAVAVRRRAKCLGRRVGAVLVKEDRIVATGFNGTPSGLTNCDVGGCPRCNNAHRFGPGEGYELCLCVHAEINCLLMAAKFGVAVAGATIYTTVQPCFGCLKALYQAGIVRVVYIHAWQPAEPHFRDVYHSFSAQAFGEQLQQMGVGYIDPEQGWAQGYARAG